MKKALLQGLLVIVIVIGLVVGSVKFDINNSYGKTKENVETKDVEDISDDGIFDEFIDKDKIEPEIYKLIYGKVKSIQIGNAAIIRIEDSNKKIIQAKIDEKTLKVDNELLEIASLDNVNPGEMIGILTSDEVEKEKKEIYAKAIVYGKIDGFVSVSLHKIEEIEKNEKNISILTDAGSMKISIDTENLKAYGVEMNVNPEELQVEKLILTYYNVVLESYPGQAFSTKTLIIK